MKTPHFNVVIATPGSAMEVEYVKSLVETVKWLTEQGLTYHLISRYSSFVSSAREKTATDSDEHDWEATEIADGRFTYDNLVWVDSDVSWTPENLAQLIEQKLDIVSAVVPANLGGALTAMRLDANGHPKQLTWADLALDAEPVEVDGVGFGMVCFKYGVFEGTKRPWFQIRKANIPTAHYPIDYGEDYSACINFKESGYKIWMHPLVRVGHIKKMVMTI